MIRELIVVEGKDDTVAIKRAVDADTIETGGSAINREVIEQIRLAQKRRGVIVFTDPDHAGERLRRIIMERVPGCKHAFITPEEGSHKGKAGVEYCSAETIRKALDHVKTECDPIQSEISRTDLLAAGLTAHPQAAERRRFMGNILKIGYANGKQFLKRCQMFAITKKEFDEACKLMMRHFSREELQKK